MHGLPEHKRKEGSTGNPRQFVITISPTGDLWHCFGNCGRGGDAISLIKAITGLDNVGVRNWYAEHFLDRLSAQRPETDTTEPEAAAETEPSDKNDGDELEPLSFYLDLSAEAAREYLESRGISVETAEYFGVGYAKRGMMKGRVCFPIYRPNGEDDENPCAYCGRAVSDEVEPKYLWPKDFKKSKILFGLIQATDEDDPYHPLAVVEGPFSVLALNQHGIPAVCTLGAQMSAEQAARIAATGRPVWICYDPDEAGLEGARKAKEMLGEAGCRFVSTITLPDQPDTVDGETLKTLLGI
jgi:DNA primase